jgi:hypothetical protein
VCTFSDVIEEMLEAGLLIGLLQGYVIEARKAMIRD